MTDYNSSILEILIAQVYDGRGWSEVTLSNSPLMKSATVNDTAADALAWLATQAD